MRLVSRVPQSIQKQKVNIATTQETELTEHKIKASLRKYCKHNEKGPKNVYSMAKHHLGVSCQYVSMATSTMLAQLLSELRAEKISVSLQVSAGKHWKISNKWKTCVHMESFIWVWRKIWDSSKVLPVRYLSGLGFPLLVKIWREAQEA